jgi:hypothetical protein
MEELFYIPGFEPFYKISKKGEVYSYKNNRHGLSSEPKKLKPVLMSNGYLKITLHKDKKAKQFTIHALLAITFMNHKFDGTNKIVVDHINNIRTDNRLENLQLITNRQNSSKDKIGGSSKYVGVCWLKHRNKFESRIRFKGKLRYLGHFEKEYDAHLAYQKALKEINNNTFI